MAGSSLKSSGCTISLCNHSTVNFKPYFIADKGDVDQREFIMLENARVSLPAFVQRVLSSVYRHQDFLSEIQWCFCRYTGYVRGLRETFGNTVVPAQHRAAAPAPGDFLHTRSHVPAAPAPERDSCNFPDEYKPTASQPNLWPSMQSTGALPHKSLQSVWPCPAGSICCPLVYVRLMRYSCNWH